MSIIKKIKFKNEEGEVTEHVIGADASNVAQDIGHRFVSDAEKASWNAKQGNTVAFEEAAERKNILTGESFPVLMGKIKKFFADLKNVAFSGNYDDLANKPTLGNVASYGVANNDTTTQAGFVADARIVKTHGDEIDQLNSELTANDTKFYFDYKDGQWGFNTDPARGADTFHPFDGDWTLSFLLSCGATANVNGEIVSPSGSGTVTIKCSNRAISQTSGTTVRGGGGHPVHSNECHASVSNFQLSYS